jgi:hypothetical protein
MTHLTISDVSRQLTGYRAHSHRSVDIPVQHQRVGVHRRFYYYILRFTYLRRDQLGRGRDARGLQGERSQEQFGVFNVSVGPWGQLTAVAVKAANYGIRTIESGVCVWGVWAQRMRGRQPALTFTFCPPH